MPAVYCSRYNRSTLNIFGFGDLKFAEKLWQIKTINLTFAVLSGVENQMKKKRK